MEKNNRFSLRGLPGGEQKYEHCFGIHWVFCGQRWWLLSSEKTAKCNLKSWETISGCIPEIASWYLTDSIAWKDIAYKYVF